MKKIYLLLMFVALAGMGFGQVFFTEFADPNNNSNARFIELYNSGGSSVDFTTGSGWKINKYTNGSATVSTSINLTGTVAAGAFYIIAYDYSAGTFQSVYGFAPDQLDAVQNGVAGANGDDTFELVDGSGSVVDFYGEQPHVDLTGTVWEYEDGRAERASGATGGLNPPTDADWNTWSDGPGGDVVQTRVAPDDFDPGSWIGASSSTPTITLSPTSLTDFSYVVGSGPSTEQSFTVEGSNLTADITLAAPTNYEISETSGSGYTSPITLAQSGGTVSTTTIYTRLKAGLTAGDYNNEDITATSSGATDKTLTCSGTVNKLEPSNHVATFAAGTPNSSSIPLTWLDNDGTVAADGFLVMINTTGTFTAPTDGIAQADDTDVSDGSGVVNVASGDEAYTWTNLSSSTQYYFTIYPYTNSGSAIDYKTDGTVPTANATTAAAAAEPTSGDLEITEVNSTNTANASYAEIYNTTGNELSLAKVHLEFYNDGASTATNTLDLTGSIAAHSYIVIARAQSDFNTAYGFNPDFVFSGMYINGGADGLILTHDDNGTLDQFNAAPNGTVSMTDNHLYYRFNYPNGGTDLTADWDDSGYEKNGTPKAENKITWLTSGDTDWGTATNWDNGDKPSKGVDVIIPSGTFQPIVDESPATPGACMNMTINSGASVTVMVGGYLTVNGTLTNNAGNSGLVVQSDATGNGSLIFASGTPDATVQRYIAGYSDADHGWHDICSPVDMTVAGSGWEPGSTTPDNDDLYYWDEATNQWMNYKASAFSFTQGQGYLAAYETTATKAFTGSLRSTSITQTNLSRDNVNGRYGWHLFGNPFSSAIEWNNNGDWVFTNIGNVSSVWDESGATYVNPATGDPIPSTNGFFIQVADGFDGNNTFTIPASARVHNSTDNYKSTASNSESNTLKMTVTTDANTFYNKIRVGFNADATQEWDVKYDAHKMYGAEAAPELWTISNGEEFSVNTLPFNQQPFDLPLNFKAGADGNYTITFSGIDSFDANSSITLEDLFTGKTVDVRKNQTYSYTAAKEDANNRFVLHFYNVTSTPEIGEANNKALIYSYNNNIIVKATDKQLNGKVEIINILGQTMETKSVSNSNFFTINTNLNKGVYIVRYSETDGYTQAQKVIIN